MVNADRSKGPLYGNARRGVEAGSSSAENTEGTSSDAPTVSVAKNWILPYSVVLPTPEILARFGNLEEGERRLLELTSQGLEPGEINTALSLPPEETRRIRNALMARTQAKSAIQAVYWGSLAEGVYQEPLEHLRHAVPDTVKPIALRVLWLVANGLSPRETTDSIHRGPASYMDIIGDASRVLGAKNPHNAARIASEDGLFPVDSDLVINRIIIPERNMSNAVKENKPNERGKLYGSVLRAVSGAATEKAGKPDTVTVPIRSLPYGLSEPALWQQRPEYGDLDESDKDMLDMLSRGQNIKEITATLGSEEGTIRRTYSHARDKIGAITTPQAVYKACVKGIFKKPLEDNPSIEDLTMELEEIAEILRPMLQGHNNIGAAKSMKIDAITYDKRIAEVRKALGARNTSHAVRIAYELGIITRDSV